MKKTSRPTIGFLTANLNLGASRVLWPGILDAAEKGDVNLISYPGGRLNSSENFEGQRNVIFDLINLVHLDGLVSWTSALAGTRSVTPEEIIQFHQRYRALPTVSLAGPIEYGPQVSIDGYRGMQSLVSHLVDIHGYHRIALIRGPEGHPYALERYHAFLDVLGAKGLTADPNLISPMMNWEKGDQAMGVLIDERNLEPGVDFQAVVAVSDLLAIGALRVLVDRGIRVPADVAVAGFNDIEEGRLVRPPLTSVSLPFYDQGQQAVKTLLSGLAGKQVPDKVVLDSRLLIRQSCGCSSKSIDLAGAGSQDDTLKETPNIRQQTQERLVEQIVRVISNRGVAATWAKLLIDTFAAEVNGESPGQFISALDSMLKQGKLDGDETAAWQTAISVLRRNLLPVFDVEQKIRAEDLFGQARVVIGEAIQHAQSIQQVEIERQNRLLGDLGQSLITTFDVEKLTDVLTKRLPGLGIHSCYLALYERDAEPPDSARLILAYTDGKRTSLDQTGRGFTSDQFVPPDLLPERRYSFVVEPLYFQNERLGFVVFEVGPRDGDVYEVLRGHISSALKGALLFQEANEARQVAERADQVKTRLLANVSHELRTPLNIIIGHTQRILDAPPPNLENDLEHIHHSAEHQLRIINDLLDLSRAEINALDLYPTMLDPKPLLEEAFVALSKDAPTSDEVTWQLAITDPIPMLEADPVRLRQVLLNLLSNAAKFTERGQITLGAECTPPHLHIWVADTGPGIPTEIVDRIYEPFFTHEGGEYRKGGIGLGLSITKHLIALHHGVLTLDTQLGQGSTFHILLPLPERIAEQSSPDQSTISMLWLISQSQTIPAEIMDFGQRRSLNILKLNLDDDLNVLFSEGCPSIVAWDLTSGGITEDWRLIRRLQNHPKLRQTPFILFQEGSKTEIASGFTSLVVKPTSNQALWESIQPALPSNFTGTILIVDDDEKARQATISVVKTGLPDYQIRIAEDGESGLAAMLSEPPDLLILDLVMPKMDGFDVLDAMRADERTRQVPVVILSARQLTFNDIQRLEQHADVTLQSKGILSEEEIIISLHRSLFGSETLPPQTGALVKRSVAYLHQNYIYTLSRSEVADAIGVNEDYLTRIFKQELGISPWDYLNRYRIFQAKELLRQTHDSVGHIGQRVGFSDASYFSRVFRRLTGVSPGTYRKQIYR